VWAEAAKWLNKFDDAVLTTLDVDGYPVSARVDTRGYDAATGELPVALPHDLRVVAGPANLLAHYHDEKLWGLQMITVKGSIAERGDGLVFRSARFDPPSRLAFIAFVKNARSAAKKYLERRNLSRPEVNWSAIKEITRRSRSQAAPPDSFRR
jgi:hypothetical protein